MSLIVVRCRAARYAVMGAVRRIIRRMLVEGAGGIFLARHVVWIDRSARGISSDMRIAAYMDMVFLAIVLVRNVAFRMRTITTVWLVRMTPC